MNYICGREKNAKFQDFFFRFRKIVRVHLIAKINFAKEKKTILNFVKKICDNFAKNQINLFREKAKFSQEKMQDYFF